MWNRFITRSQESTEIGPVERTPRNLPTLSEGLGFQDRSHDQEQTRQDGGKQFAQGTQGKVLPMKTGKPESGWKT
jgi:hypothetical protein